MSQFTPVWLAFNREAALASECLSSGLGSLRKADYANKGLYTYAFYGLSIGLERIYKIVFCLDYAISNGGAFPSDDLLRGTFGHDLSKLFGFCSNLRKSDGSPYSTEDAEANLKTKIIEFLTEFAEYTRYYNLNLIIGNARAKNDKEPLLRWFVDVGSDIASIHYTQRMRERDEANAGAMAGLFGPYMHVTHTAEDGSELSDAYSAALQTGRSKFMQKYGTFYCVRLCRYSYRILRGINDAAHAARIDVPYMCEHFFPFENDDSYLLGRTTFPPPNRLS